MKSVRAIKPVASRVMGIDASTKSLAFCIMDRDGLVKYGEVFFNGADVYERMVDAKRKTRALIKEFDVDYVAIEAAVVVRSVSVGLKMAYVFGAIMSELLDGGIRVKEVRPLTWQAYIGNPALTPKEKSEIRGKSPGKSRSWYMAKYREFRKQRTLEYFNKKFGVEVESDNVSDSFGLAWYAVNNTV